MAGALLQLKKPGLPSDIYIKTETVRSLLYQVAAANDPYRVDPALAAAVKAKASAPFGEFVVTCIEPAPAPAVYVFAPTVIEADENP